MRKVARKKPWWARPGGLFKGLIVLGLIVLSVHSFRVSKQSADKTMVSVFSQPHYTPGQKGALRVVVYRGDNQAPLPNSSVKVGIFSSKEKSIAEAAATTNADGIALLWPKIPNATPTGKYRIKVLAKSSSGSNQIEKQVFIKRTYRILVTTDKPVYKPGQRIRIRALALSAIHQKPAADKPITIEVEDGKGNKVFKLTKKCSKYGIAAADFALAQQVNLGNYKITATIGDTQSHRTVKVKYYTLPRYKFSLSTNKPYFLPGETVKFQLRAQYTFGKPVAKAKVSIRLDTGLLDHRPFAALEGVTDKQGSYAGSVELKGVFLGNRSFHKDALVRVTATLVDATGQKQSRAMTFRVTRSPIRVGLFPEGGKLVNGVTNRVYIVTMYPDGRPAETKVQITFQTKKTKKEWKLRTSSMGVATLSLKPGLMNHRFLVTATDSQGRKGKLNTSLSLKKQQHFLVRTDKAVYSVGGTVRVEALSSRPEDRIFFDLTKGGQTFYTHTLKVRQGKANFAFDLPRELDGTLEIHAYRIANNGRMIRQDRVIQVVRKSSLQVKVSLDKKSYRPGEKASIQFSVHDKKGAPVQAALSLAAVDEAVFALYNLHPDLTLLYFKLQEELLRPRYQLRSQSIKQRGLKTPTLRVNPPLTPRRAIQSPPQKKLLKDWEEARHVLFSAARTAHKPTTSHGENYSSRIASMSKAKRVYFYKLGFSFSLTMFAYFLFLFVKLLFGLLFSSLKVGSIFIPKRSNFDIPLYDHLSRRLILWWTLSLNLPILGAIGVAQVINRSNRNMGVLIGYGAISLVCAFFLGKACRKHHLHPISDMTPFFQRIVQRISPAYLSLMFGIPLFLTCAGKVVPYDQRDKVILFLPILLLISLLTCGLLSVMSRRILLATGYNRKNQQFDGAESLGYMRGFWLIISRAMLSGVSVIAVMVVLFFPSFSRYAPDRIQDATKGIIRYNRTPLARSAMGKPDSSKKKKPGIRVRKNFPETLLWRPQLLTNAKGKATLNLPLADSITSWRLTANAVTSRGQMGGITRGIRVFQPFFVDIDFPTHLTQKDQVNVPVAIFNYLKTSQTIRIKVKREKWCRLLSGSRLTLRLRAGEVRRISLRIKARKPGRHTLTVTAKGSEFSDAVQRSVIVKPNGKEIVQTVNGSLKANLVHKIQIPKKAIDGSLDLYAKIYPGLLSQVVEGLDNIFRMPSGCFEQTSSTTYPNLLVLQYLRQTKKALPKVEIKALRYIKIGYQRLTSFEVKGGGFSLYGRAPARLGLTAYGLMQFRDMAKVSYVDPRLITRTRQWLLGRQLSDGSWKPRSFRWGRRSSKSNKMKLYKKLRLTAYIAWSLAATGKPTSKLQSALQFLEKHQNSKEMRGSLYITALTANALLAAGEKERAEVFLKRFSGFQQKTPKGLLWKEKQRFASGMFYSSGKTFSIVNTALVLQALLQSKRNFSDITKGVRWLIQQKNRYGTWYSTQATVLALRSLVASAAQSRQSKKKFSVTVTANGKVVKQLEITPANSDVYRILSMRNLVKKGTNTVALEASGKGNIDYQIVGVHYLRRKRRPAKPKLPPALDIQLSYDKTRLRTSDTVTCSVAVTYQRPGVATMPLIDLGIPPGFDVVQEDFQTLQRSKKIDRYNVAGRQVILYLSKIKSGVPFRFTYRLKARYPLRVQTPPSKAYLYYQPSIKAQSTPTRLIVR